MKMVVTLKCGVQIKMDVEDFSTGSSPVFGEFRSLKWTRAVGSTSEIQWLDVAEIAAVHAEDMEPLPLDLDGSQ